MKKALIIEDDTENSKILSLILKKAGYEVCESDSAENGIEFASKFKPDLILMDINLPGISGLNATHILKEDESTQDIKVIAMSVYSEDKIKNSSRMAGCDGYLEKPIYYQNFLEKLSSIA